MLKARFRGLMTGLRLRKQMVEAAFHTFDGYDIEKWENDAIWENVDPDAMDDGHISFTLPRDITTEVNLYGHQLEPIKAMIDKPKPIVTTVIPLSSVSFLQR